MARSQAETERVRYLLGLASPAEREHVESEYFHDAEAFQKMLAAEDDLIDAYARGELSHEERRRFEKRFLDSSQGKGRVQFSRALASAGRPVATRRWDPVRIAAIAAVVVIAVVLSWLVVERRRMSNELSDLRAAHAQLHDETAAPRRDAEGPPIAEGQSQSPKSVPSPTPRPKRAPISALFVSKKKIVDLPLNANNVVDPPSLDGVDISEAAIKIRFDLDSPAEYSEFRVTIATEEGRSVKSLDWRQPPKPNQTSLSPPPIKATDLPAGAYRVRLTGKDADGSFVPVAEYSFKVVVKK